VQDKKAQEMAARFFADDDILITAGKEGNFNAIRLQHETDLHLLQKVVYLRKTGIAAGAPAAKEWLPDHDIALSINRAANIPAIDTTREQALRFLKREDMGIEGVEKGWHLVKYEGEGLGWVKALGNRINNYLPKHWRIRMDIEEI
jgi:NOL1/NOP2/fmu family ribosome biogenesis protein